MNDPHYGPLRRGLAQHATFPPWAYLDHGPIDYVTRSDHRAEDGTLVSAGTPGKAERRDGMIIHIFGDGRRVVSDGRSWVLDVEDLPLTCIELLLPA